MWATTSLLPSAVGTGADVLYGGLGFVFTLISAALYNLLAGVVGGVEIDLA